MLSPSAAVAAGRRQLAQSMAVWPFCKSVHSGSARSRAASCWARALAAPRSDCPR